ncbi:AAA family ATPase, partial [Paracoccus fontiphilus]
MKIRALHLTNVRRFAGHTARIEGIGDGITVLCEPNEFGKSTFFDAIHALFFERHRATRAAIKALQPHVGGAPEVAVDLDLPNGRYRVEKRWLTRASARVIRDGRTVAQDDEAEAWIDRMLGAGLSGPSGLLWVRQGLLGLEPEGSSASDKSDRERALSARRDLLSSVAGEIEMMTGGRRLDAVVAKVGDALGRLATATGRPKAGGEWARAEAEADALRAEEADLAAKA